MKNLLFQFFGYGQGESRSASALLLSFFLMTVLISASISVSILVVKDLVTVRTIVGGEQAYYASEGATELGLLALEEHLPGYEPSGTYSFLSSAMATLASVARSDTSYVPCEGQGSKWHALAKNESVQIPLFAETESGTIDSITQFYVAFYAADENGDVDRTDIPVRDVLRWKVLGRMGDMNNPGDTEAMSEYIRLYNDEGYYDETSPTKFGTADLGGLPPGYQDGKFYSSSGNKFESGYPIETFLNYHVYNYLMLTNIVTESTANDVLYYQFYSLDSAPVCEYVELAAEGSSDYGSAQQDLNTLVKEGESLPVFDFVIYHTDYEEGASGLGVGLGAGLGTSPVLSPIDADWAAILLGL